MCLARVSSRAVCVDIMHHFVDPQDAKEKALQAEDSATLVRTCTANQLSSKLLTRERAAVLQYEQVHPASVVVCILERYTFLPAQADTAYGCLLLTQGPGIGCTQVEM